MLSIFFIACPGCQEEFKFLWDLLSHGEGSGEGQDRLVGPHTHEPPFPSPSSSVAIPQDMPIPS